MTASGESGAEAKRHVTDRRCTEVLFEPMQLGSAGDRHDPEFLGEQPREGDLRGSRVLASGDDVEPVPKRLIRLPILGSEARHRVPEVRAVERRRRGDLSGEESNGSRQGDYRMDTGCRSRCQVAGAERELQSCQVLKEPANELQGCADGEKDKPCLPLLVLDQHPRPHRAGKIPEEYKTVRHRNGVLSSNASGDMTPTICPRHRGFTRAGRVDVDRALNNPRSIRAICRHQPAGLTSTVAHLRQAALALPTPEDVQPE
jgi:hypothetical protein